MPTPNNTNVDPDEAAVGGADLAYATDAETDELDRALTKGDTTDTDPGANNGNADDVHHDDEDDEPSGERSARRDTELEEARTPEERDAIRARRRTERRQRKDNQRERMAALQRQTDNLAAQNRQLAEQVARLSNNDNASRIAQLDSSIQEAAAAYTQAQGVHTNAVSKADGTTATRAVEFMTAAKERVAQLQAAKDAMVNQSRNTPAPNINPTVRNNAAKFAKDNQWYRGPQSGDSDSQVMTLLDNAVAREGFDPAGESYWSELDARARKYLPHRYGGTSTQDGEAGGGPTGASNSGAENTSYNGDTTQRNRPRSPVGGANNRGNRSPENGSGEGGFKLSSERVKAMKEAGIWDDPDRRQKMIAKYREVDRSSS